MGHLSDGGEGEIIGVGLRRDRFEELTPSLDSQLDAGPGILRVESKLGAQCPGARLHVPDTTASTAGIRQRATSIVPDLDEQHIVARVPGVAAGGWLVINISAAPQGPALGLCSRIIGVGALVAAGALRPRVRFARP